MKFLKQVAILQARQCAGRTASRVGEHGGSWGWRHAAPSLDQAIPNFDDVLDYDELRIVSITADIGDGTYAQQPIASPQPCRTVTGGSSMTLTLSNGDTVVVAAAVDGRRPARATPWRLRGNW